MRAMVVGPDGAPELNDLPEPTPGPGEVVFEVRAGSVNRFDLLQRIPRPSGSPPTIVGMDAAGKVEAVGRDVEGVKVGDRAMALAPGGGLASRIAVDAGLVWPLPDDWSYEQGAAAILGLLTEHNAIATAGGLKRGESIVVGGATSAVGMQALQIAAFLGAAPIFGTSRSLDRAEALEGLGATQVIDTSADGWPRRVVDHLGGDGAAIVVDHVGGSVFAENIELLGIGGRLVSVGRLGGLTATLDLDELARKRLSLIGVTFRTRSAAEKRAVVSAARKDLHVGLEAGRLKPPIGKAMSWLEADAAQQLMRDGGPLGKIVLSVEPD
jgi:NADPH2:quinone reductase